MKYYLSIFSIIFLLTACKIDKPVEQSGAGISMDAWALARSYPTGKILTKNISQAFELQRLQTQLRSGNQAEWEAMGPKNIGGRTICLAFHPTDSTIIYAGSAGGGLWKTTTEGVGANAWEYVSTGFPVIGVGAIAIDPTDPEVIYIGTGEVYNYTAARPGVVNRLTRGSYGIGILKTINGGLTWEKSLDWSLSELTGVQDMKIDPTNTNIVYAATTEGLFKSIDAGDSWENIHNKSMATDVELKPDDSQIIYVAHGSFLNEDKGVYVSKNGGDSFTLMNNGLPANYEGKTRLDISQSNPNILYASVGDVFESRGLFRSDDAGETWISVSAEDVAKYQGWYSHDIAIKPDDPETVINVGVDVFRSTRGGTGLTQVSDWSAWYFGQTPVGGPEGPDFYVHADVHAVYFHPNNPNKVLTATDGGIFISNDAGMTWEGRNGAYQTQQFYANFSNSTTDSLLALGGMQDNSTAVYTGSDAWTRVIGGDGMSTAINPKNDNIMYGSYQYLNIVPSYDRGQTFNFGDRLRINSANIETSSFNGPFELAPSNPDIIYAGFQRLHISVDAGETWNFTTPGFVDFENPIVTIEVNPEDPSLLFFSTSPEFSSPPHVYKSVDNGATLIDMQGLPDRVAMDFAFEHNNPLVAYVVFSGFNTDHVYKTEDGGENWFSVSNGLPDVPTNTIIIDPIDPQFIYVGNDIGVYVSTDGGENWQPFNTLLPDAIMAMDLSISPSNRKLRVATHGNGVFQTDLLDEPLIDTKVVDNDIVVNDFKIFPNPVATQVTLEYTLTEKTNLQIDIYDNQGRLVKKGMRENQLNGIQKQTLEVSDLVSGAYYIQLQTQKGRLSKAFIKE